MNDLVKLVLTALIDAGGAQQLKSATTRMSMTAFYGLGSVVAGLAIPAFALSALWIFAQPYVGAAGASLAVAGTLTLLWIALFIFTHATSPARRPPPESGDALQLLIKAVVAGMAAGGSHRSATPDR